LSGHRRKATEQGALTSWRLQREGFVRTQKGSNRARHTHFLETAEGGTSGHRKKLTEQGALTNWRPQMERLVRTRKESDRARHTHFLETATGGTCHDTEGKRTSKAHSLPGDRKGRDLSGHGTKLTKQGMLTSWRPQREGLVRTWKETDQARCTHCLETAEGGTCQDTEGKRLSKAHSLPGDRRGRDLSGHRRKATKKDTLTSWRPQRQGLQDMERN